MNKPESLLNGLLTPAPSIELDTAQAVVREQYGIEANAERLTGERDENFWIHTRAGQQYVLKVANAQEPAEITELQMAAMLHLERTDPTIPCPRVIRSKDDTTLVSFRHEDGVTRTAMLYTFLPGKTLLSAVRSPAQRIACGRLLARLGQVLRRFEHAAGRRALIWDLRQLPRLQGLLPQVPGLPCADFLANFLTRFASEISPRLDALRRQFVHNDFNARNILVDPEDESRITGVIDFGDSVHTALVADVAVGVIGQLASADTADDSIRDFVSAYREVEPLVDEELQILNWLIAGRIVQNVLLTSWHRSHNPAGTHFDGFDAAYFGWRVELARRLISSAPVISPI